MPADPPERSPWPEGAEPDQLAEPAEGAQIDVVVIDDESTIPKVRGVNPVVAGIGIGVAGNLVYDAGKWVIGKVWDAATRTPITDFSRPPILYSPTNGLTYRLQPGGFYLPSGGSAAF